MPRLTDPWFEAHFIGFVAADGKSFRSHYEDGSPIKFSESQGVQLWCSCGYGKPEFPIDGARPHGLMVLFANPPGGPFAADFGRLTSGRCRGTRSHTRGGPSAATRWRT